MNRYAHRGTEDTLLLIGLTTRTSEQGPRFVFKNYLVVKSVYSCICDTTTTTNLCISKIRGTTIDERLLCTRKFPVCRSSQLPRNNATPT